jgi:hypothetical protein
VRQGFPELFDTIDAQIVHGHDEIAGANAFAQAGRRTRRRNES